MSRLLEITYVGVYSQLILACGIVHIKMLNKCNFTKHLYIKKPVACCKAFTVRIWKTCYSKSMLLTRKCLFSRQYLKILRLLKVELRTMLATSSILFHEMLIRNILICNVLYSAHKVRFYPWTTGIYDTLVTSVEMCQMRVDKKHFLQPYK